MLCLPAVSCSQTVELLVSDADDRAADVSVVVPTCQQRLFLAEALQSVVAQTHAASEIVVVDDGSEEPVDDIVAEFPGVVLHRQENQGASAARNTGYALTHSPYVVFLDGDDRLLPAALESGFASLLAHPLAPFSSGRSRLIDTDGQVLSDNWLPQPRKTLDLYAEMMRRPYVCPPGTVMFRRTALEEYGGWKVGPDMWGVEDWEIYLRMAREVAPAYHPDVVCEYRIHPGQTSRNASRMRQNCLKLLADHALPDVQDRDRLRACRAGDRWVRAHFGLQEARESLAASTSPRSVLRAAGAFARYSPIRVGDAIARRTARA